MREPLRDFTDDAFLDGRVRVRQPKQGYRAAMDPVLLAAAVPSVNDRGARAGGPVLDLGCGAGVALLCYGARVAHAELWGMERDPETAHLARANLDRNAMAGRGRILTGDLLAPPDDLPQGVFAEVMANPPYHRAEASAASPHPQRAASNREGEALLADWIEAGLRALAPKGGLTLIHRADRISEICALLRGRAGAITIFPLWPRAGRAAKRVIVRARKGVKSPDLLAAGLMLHAGDPEKEEGQRYTREAEAVLRDGAALSL
ncbi:MAG: methyltransferase [Marivibrio sp.]|uniref:tRNA1(Val) (adenine(37)-N6)-methyltransferase n=1 Tax=Marivibrio sp. TaxID=2039719 RepID=UPI0032ED7D29